MPPNLPHAEQPHVQRAIARLNQTDGQHLTVVLANCRSGLDTVASLQQAPTNIEAWIDHLEFAAERKLLTNAIAELSNLLGETGVPPALRLMLELGHANEGPRIFGGEDGDTKWADAAAVYAAKARADLTALQQKAGSAEALRSTPKVPTIKGEPGRRPSYSDEVLIYARKLKAKRRHGRRLTAKEIKKACREQFPEEPLPPNDKAFRAWLNRPRKKLAT